MIIYNKVCDFCVIEKKHIRFLNAFVVAFFEFYVVTRKLVRTIEKEVFKKIEEKTIRKAKRKIKKQAKKIELKALNALI